MQGLQVYMIMKSFSLTSLDIPTWHNNIPEDEIWLKIGGDKGGGNFKQVIKIANINHPDSPQNTVVVTR